MTTIEVIKYLSFGFSFVTVLIAFTLSDDLRNSKFFKKCLFAGIISGILGIGFELTDFFSLNKGLTLVLMFIPLIYLGYFELFRRLFKKWKKTDPYITSTSSKIGGTPLNGVWTKYPKGRKIMSTDFLFSFLQALVPIFTIFGLIILIILMNR